MALSWLHKLLLKGLFFLGKGLISLRYKVQIKGLSKTLTSKRNGVVFLPNHPAEIDPVILSVILGPIFSPRFVIVEHFYKLKGFRVFMDLVRVVPIPTMSEKANKWRAKEVAKKYQGIISSLQMGENFVIYPSGMLKVTGFELLGGASLVHQLLQDLPDAEVVLVRTTGLWGSRFSRALTGQSPDFSSAVKASIKTLLKNGIFFAPKRKVLIEFEKLPKSFPKGGTRIDCNRFLEDWYNRYPDKGPEPLSLVSNSFWKEDLPTPFLKKTAITEEELKIPLALQKEIFAYVAKLAKNPSREIQLDMHLSQDLGMDSLDIAEIYVFLDHKYEVSDLKPGQIHTVKDIIKAALGKMESNEEEKSVACFFPKEPNRPPVQKPQGESLQEAFLHSCDRMNSYVACADNVSGAITYRKCKMTTLVLSEKFKVLPGLYVGVMLPSSNAAYLAIFSLLLAGKIPVILNWTVGTKALDHAVDVADLRVVITSKRFLDKLETEELGKCENLFLFLEDVKESISWKEKLKGCYLSLKHAQALCKKLLIDPESTAVLLFTSGTEALPKAVPLSHKNLLSNQRSGLSAVTLTKNDLLYGILPPFHSFGFSVTGILPILSGLKVFYAPNPTDSFGMAHDINKQKITLLCCAPSFIRALFSVSDENQLQSLRLIVSGAEKTPKELFDTAKVLCKESEMIEGYGITECAPIVTLNRPGSKREGVGEPLIGQEICIINPDTCQKLPLGEKGEVCIHGPNVFSGYYRSQKNPFIDLEGKRWYRSGDLGRIDEKGNLHLIDRRKRFVKIGGEMIPLGGLEEELLHAAKELMWYTSPLQGPPLALIAKESESEKTELILFTTFSVTKEKVNEALKNVGWGRVAKISEIVVKDEIPVMGTGKIHYRLLEDELSK